jgi:hypothetical protein
MTIEAGNAKTRFPALAVVGRVEFLLRKRSEQKPQPIELHRRENVLKEPIVIVNGDNFSSRHIP